mmetsp:Transcript_37128/g.51529  ORF Transcript_37128/g.51529 Transcript_37128/m.51529 type:complete len:323 (+) Transcript_37128:97-1065(+)
MPESLQAKQRGSEAYVQGDFQLAVNEFSKAINSASKSDENLHIYYSNRCAAYLQVSELDCALQDAQECTRIQPKFAKGWSRLGNCLLRKNRLDAAIPALIKSIELDPSNADTKASLADARAKKQATGSSQNRPSSSNNPGSTSGQSTGGFALPSWLSGIDTRQLKYQASMLWWRITQNKMVLYGLVAIVIYVLFFRGGSSSGESYSSDSYSSSRSSQHYDSKSRHNSHSARPEYDVPYDYGGHGGGLFGFDWWTIAMISVVCYVGYKQGWHRNLQNMSPMTMYFIFNMLQSLLGGRRGGGGGYGGGYGRGYGGFGGRRRGFF